MLRSKYTDSQHSVKNIFQQSLVAVVPTRRSFGR